MKRLKFYSILFLTAIIVFGLINIFIISKVDPYEFGQLVVSLFFSFSILIIVIISSFIYEISQAIKKDNFDFNNSNGSSGKNKRLKKVLLIIMFVIISIFFFIRLIFSGNCWQEAFFLQKQGTCQDQLATRMGYGKKDLEKKEADKQAGLIKQNYSLMTLDATNITTDSATLNGKVVNSVNNVPLYGLPFFRYGVSKEKIHQESNPTSYFTNGQYSISVKKLTPNTTYYYYSAVFFRSGNPGPDDFMKSDVILSFKTL